MVDFKIQCNVIYPSRSILFPRLFIVSKDLLMIKTVILRGSDYSSSSFMLKHRIFLKDGNIKTPILFICRMIPYYLWYFRIDFTLYKLAAKAINKMNYCRTVYSNFLTRF